MNIIFLWEKLKFYVQFLLWCQSRVGPISQTLAQKPQTEANTFLQLHSFSQMPIRGRERRWNRSKFSSLSLAVSPLYYNSSCSHHCRRRRPLVVAPPPPPPLIFLGRHVSQIPQIGCSNFLFSIFNLYSVQGS